MRPRRRGRGSALLLVIVCIAALASQAFGQETGTACSVDTDCNSQRCRGGFCCADQSYNCQACKETEGTCDSCYSNQFMLSAKCYPKRPVGESCSTDDWCTFGNCNVFCCEDSTYASTCTQCGTDGRCSSCPAPASQNLYGGQCYTKVDPGESCSHDGECTATHQCRGGYCCASGYVNCTTCAASSGQCASCPSDRYKSNNQCVPKEAAGGACSTDNQCLSGECSLRCCAAGYIACVTCRGGDGRCQTCDTTVRYMTATNNCALKKANGASCGGNVECQSGSCVGGRCCAAPAGSCANCSSSGDTCETCADGWTVDAASGNCTEIPATATATASATVSDGNASTTTGTGTVASPSATRIATASGVLNTTSETATVTTVVPRDPSATPERTRSAIQSVSRTLWSKSPVADHQPPPTQTRSAPTSRSGSASRTTSRSLAPVATQTGRATRSASPLATHAQHTATRRVPSNTPSRTLVPAPPRLPSAVPVTDATTVELVTQNTARGIAIGAASSGTPAVATQAGRVEALSALIACRSDESNGEGDGAQAAAEQPGWSTHPTRFRAPFAGRGRAAWDAAAVIGNVLLLVVGGPMLAHGVAAPLRLLWQRRFGHTPGYTYAAAVTWCRSPGVLSLAVAFLLPSVAERSAALATDPLADAVTAAGRAVGVLGLLLVAAVHIVAVAVFRRWFSATFAWEKASDGSNDAAAAPTTDVHSRLVRALSGVDAWAAVAAERSSTLLRRFGMFFDSFSPRAPWFLLVDVGVACLVGCLAGMQAALGCAALGWAITAVSVAFALLVTVLRPHAAPFDIAAYVAIAWLQAAAALAATVAPADASSTAAAHSAAAMSVTVLGVYEVAKAVYLQFVHRLQQEQQRTQGAAKLHMPAADCLMEPPDLSPPLPLAKPTAASIEEPLISNSDNEALAAAHSPVQISQDADQRRKRAALDLDELLGDDDTTTASPVASRYRERVGQLTAAEREAERRRLETRTDLAALLGHEDEARAARELAALIDDTAKNGDDEDDCDADPRLLL